MATLAWVDTSRAAVSALLDTRDRVSRSAQVAVGQLVETPR